MREQGFSQDSEGLPDDFSAFDYFASTRISIVVSDALASDNPLIFVNRAFELTTGYSRSFAVGRNCRFLQGEDTDPDDVRALAEAIAEEREIILTIRNYRADGTPFLNELTITPVPPGVDRPARFFVGMQRVVSGKGARLSGETLAALRQQVVAHVGVLAVVPDPSDTARTPDPIWKRLDCLEVLGDDMVLLDLGAGRADLGAYLSHIASFSSLSNAGAGVTVNTRFARMSAPFETCARIGLVLSELLDNALQHAFRDMESGSVDVSAELSAQTLEITVADDGVSASLDHRWPDRSDSFGSRVMRKMIEALSARLSVGSDIDGTSVCIRVDAAAFGIRPLS